MNPPLDFNINGVDARSGDTPDQFIPIKATLLICLVFATTVLGLRLYTKIVVPKSVG